MKSRGLHRNNGFTLVYPMWTLDELKQAAPYFNEMRVAVDDMLSDDQIAHRFLHFGGVPRHIFASAASYKSIKDAQTRAMQCLTSEQVKSIVLGNVDPMDSRGISLHRGLLLGFVAGPRYDYGTAISPLVDRFVHFKYMKANWDVICCGKGNTKAYEKYCKLLFVGDTKVQMTLARPSVGRGKSKHVRKIKEGKVFLGGCKAMKCVEDVQQAALASPGILFYPAGEKDKRIKFAYSEMDPDGVVHLHSFQLMKGDDQKAQKEWIADHEKVLHEANPRAKSTLYYMVLPQQFETFATNPVKYITAWTSVFHLAVPAPNETMW
jgi:hypothetical protein